MRDTWGHLQVDQGGMLLKDWKTITVAVDQEPAMGQHVIMGQGWKLTLNAGWSLEKTGEIEYSLKSN